MMNDDVDFQLTAIPIEIQIPSKEPRSTSGISLGEESSISVVNDSELSIIIKPDMMMDIPTAPGTASATTTKTVAASSSSTTADSQAIASTASTGKDITLEENLSVRKAAKALRKKILVCSTCFRKYQMQKAFNRHVMNCSSSNRKISKKDEIGEGVL